MKKLKFALLSLFLASSLAVPAGMAIVNADSQAKTDACKGLQQLDSTQKCGDSSGVESLIKTIVVLLSWIVGIASVIVIIIAGLKFVTAGGDSNAVASAKSTLLYALIGLVVAALAQFLVHFAFNQATGATACKSDPTITASDPNCK